MSTTEEEYQLKKKLDYILHGYKSCYYYRQSEEGKEFCALKLYCLKKKYLSLGLLKFRNLKCDKKKCRFFISWV